MTVIAYPVFLYCDNTSGNQSKNWNKHISFLISSAGLPCQDLALEYNIHFLCTSNLVLPLEVLSGVIEQIE